MRWRDNLWLIILILLLLLGMAATLHWGGERSRHGYGILQPAGPSPGSGQPLQYRQLA